MTKTIMSFVVGAVVGALVVSVLLSDDGSGDRPSVTTTAAVPFSETENSRAPSDPDPADADIESGRLSARSAGPADRRDAALELAEAGGFALATIDDITAALPAIERVNFRIDAIVALGRQDAQSALAAAMALPQIEQRRLALTRLAGVLAEHDPLGAIGRLGNVDPNIEFEFMIALLDSWALLDPDRVFDFLAGTDAASIPVAEFAFATLAANEPERLLGVAGGLTPSVGKAAIAAALGALIDQDPLAALPRIRELTLGSDRSALEREVATVYGERDPEAAWAWAHEGRATAGTRLYVLAGIQKIDPERALDLAMSELTSANTQLRAEMRQSIGTYLFNLADSARSEDVVTALDRLLALDDSAIEANVQQFIGSWSADAPEAALEWTLRNLARVDPSRVLASLGASVARTNVQRAREALRRLPDAHRLPWVTGVGRALAESDLAGARAWALEFPRGPLRDAVLGEYVRGEAHGGSVDVRIFDQFSDDVARGQAASQVAFGLSCDGHTALALEIAATQIVNPELREQTERQIEGNARRGATVGNTPANLFCVIGR